MSVAQPASTSRPSTLDDLARVDGKAELIDGRIAHLSPMGYRPGLIAGEILVDLKLHTRATGRGLVFSGTAAFAVPRLRSGRESFSPDIGFSDGPPPAALMKFVPGAPSFAVEVRSEGNYGPAAEASMASKRGDYFEAGTAVVWDVDPVDRLVRVYRAGSPDTPTVFGPGEVADAEPAVPGWRMAVDAMGF